MADLLVVEDDNDVAELLIVYLGLQQHSVRYAENGEVALKRIEEKLPDLIFLDNTEVNDG